MRSDVTLSDALSDDDWLAGLARLGATEGIYRPLDARHVALHLVRSPHTLIVYFDVLRAARDTNPGALPLPVALAEETGFSSLTLLSRGATWFRDPGVYGIFDALAEDGIFETYERVIFLGSGAGGYAAAAFSVAAPGATVIAFAPQATLDPEMAEWDDRYTAMRRTSFTDRYGYAPDMIEAAREVFVIYDPRVELDAMHAALFRGENVTRIRFRHGGPAAGRMAMAMGALRPILEAAGEGSLSARGIRHALRLRHGHAPWLRALLSDVHPRERPWLTAILCRAAARRTDAPRFRHHLELAEQKLARTGRRLPERREGTVTGGG